MLSRLAVPDDAAAITEIHVRSWQQAYRSLLPHEFLDGLDPARRVEQLRSIIADQSPPADATVVVCEGAHARSLLREGGGRGSVPDGLVS